MKIFQDRQNSYADMKRIPREFKVGDHMYLRVRTRKISLRMGPCAMLEPLYFGTF
jgi:hypothetical protein